MLLRCLAVRVLLPLLAAGGAACGASSGGNDSSGAADLSADERHPDAGSPAADGGAADGGATTADAAAPGPDAAPGLSDDDCDEATFLFPDPEATAVFVTGDFTTPPWADEASGALAMNAHDGVFTLSANLGSRGHHLYKFIVVHPTWTLWLHDALNPLREPDGLGDGVSGDNSVVGHWRAFIYPNVGFAPVAVTGTFTSPAWDPVGEPLLLATDATSDTGVYVQTLQLPSGTSEYSFITGDSTTWATDPYNPETASNGLGGFNSVAHVCHE